MIRYSALGCCQFLLQKGSQIYWGNLTCKLHGKTPKELLHRKIMYSHIMLRNRLNSNLTGKYIHEMEFAYFSLHHPTPSKKQTDAPGNIENEYFHHYFTHDSNNNWEQSTFLNGHEIYHLPEYALCFKQEHKLYRTCELPAC